MSILDARANTDSALDWAYYYAISSASTFFSRSRTRKALLTTPHRLIALRIASLSSVPQV
jgi:hypothetical protein